VTALEMRINGSTEFAGLPVDLDRPLVLEAMDSPTACTPATVSAVGLLVNLVYLQAVAHYAVEAVTARYQPF
jgi:hypothetical protein